MAVVFLATNDTIAVFDVSIYSYLPGLLSELALCCVSYLGITYVIDRKTRLLFGCVVSNLVSRSRAEQTAGGRPCDILHIRGAVVRRL